MPSTMIRTADDGDREFILRYDRHISEEQLGVKLSLGQYRIILDEVSEPVGVMRYGFFWDSLPFLNLIYLDEAARGKGIGGRAMSLWETEMKRLGHTLVMTSTQSDEQGQHFYRRIGYKECGCLILNAPGWEQPMELLLSKEL